MGKMTLRAAVIMAGAVSALVAMPVAAQKIDPGRPDTRVVQGVDPGTTNLNQEQALRAAQIDNNNVQNADVYRRQVEQHNRAVAEAEAARAAYEADLARNNAQTRAYEQQRAAYERAMAQWRADVEACNRGDRTRCATQQPRQ